MLAKSKTLLLAIGLVVGNLFAGDLDHLIPGIYEQFHPGVPGIIVGSTDRHQAHFVTGTDAALRALNSQLGHDFAVFPFSSVAGAFKFNYDAELNTFVKTTDTLGPLFAERGDVLGKKNLNVAFTYTFFDYDSFNGRSLSDFHLTAKHLPNSFPGGDPNEIDPGTYEEDTLDLKFDINASVKIYSFILNYGVTDSLDVGVLVPLVDVRMRLQSHWSIVVSPNNTNAPNIHTTDPNQGADPQDAQASGSAFGMGDLVLRSKYQFLKEKPVDLAALVLLKLPTGDVHNFLGSGDTTIRPVLAVSRVFHDVLRPGLNFTPHLNVGYEFDVDDTRRNSFEYVAGAEFGNSRVTLDVDFLGSRRDDGQHRVSAAVGGRWNVWKRLILSADLLFPLNGEGLRSDLVTTVGAEYSIAF